MNTSKLWTRLLATTVMTAAAAIAAPVYAQSAPAPQADDADKGEIIVVTGSRISRPEVESGSPLVATTAADVLSSGYSRVEEVLNSLPQIEAGQTAFLSNGSTGTATVDLRGLGPTRTLTLINGRRMQPGSTIVGGVAADINQIPGALISRVDVVTGGASSVYGSDAVAGVVNFIMDTKFEGIELGVSGSGYLHDNRDKYMSTLLAAKGFADPKQTKFDGTQYSADLTVGGSFADGRGHVVAYATYRKINELRWSARDYSACALNNGGTKCGGSNNSAMASFYFLDTDELSGLTSTGSLTGPANLYNFGPPNHFQRPDERYTFGAFADYEINDSIKPYLEAMFMNDTSHAQIAESGTFFANTFFVPCNSPLLTPAQQTEVCVTRLTAAGEPALGPTDEIPMLIGKRNVEGGPRINNYQYNSFRIVVGTKGAISSNWNYDLYAQIGHTGLADSYENDFLLSKLNQALDVVDLGGGVLACADPDAVAAGCLPYNVFDPAGPSAASAAWIGAVGTFTGDTTEYVVSGYVSGDIGITSPLATTPVQVVFGAEYRKEKFDYLADEIFATGALLGQGGPAPSTYGVFDVQELFTEASIVLAEDQSFAQNLELDLGYRFSDYSTSGGVHTYKVGLNWTVIPEIRLRAAYNRAVRAPNAQELYAPSGIGLWGGQDPCSGSSPILTQAQCLLTGVTAGQYTHVAQNSAAQYNALYSGNANLDPETADTITAGVIVQPRRNIVITADYWQVKMKDVVGFFPQQSLITQCATTGAANLCNRIHRGSGGNLYLENSAYVDSPNENLGGRTFRGIDLGVDMKFPLGAGRLGVDLNGTYLIEKDFEPENLTPALTHYDCTGLFGPTCPPAPKWRHNARLSYTFPETFTLTARWRYFDGVKNEVLGNQPGIGTSVPSALNAKIGAQSYFDLVLQADATDNLSFTFGINNILDRSPPLVGALGGPFNGNVHAGFYDTLGRNLFGTAKIKF
jgi:outer membrane receptor protein involved in Fe transport